MSKVVPIGVKKEDNLFELSDSTLEQDFVVPGMEEAKRFLDALGVSYEEKSKHHLKIFHVNFYLPKKTVNLDNQKKFKRTGLDFLKEVLKREGIIK